ncbi:unnamed protein product, partial [Symbiodinium necroappetens]
DDLEDGLACEYFYGQSQCHITDLAARIPVHKGSVPEIFMENGRFPGLRQHDDFCIRCTGRLLTKTPGDYKFFLSSDDGSLLYLNGEKIVDNNGCHGAETEKSSQDKFLGRNVHSLVVEMCEVGDGE